MKIKIAVIMTSSGLDEQDMEKRRRYLQAVVSPSTEIVMIPNHSAPPSIESTHEVDQAAALIAERTAEIERLGFDAAVIWCGDDPGLESARERVKIPVVGPLSASLSVARQLGETFSIITSLGSKSHVRRRTWPDRTASMLVSIETVPIPVLEIRTNLQRTKALITAAIESARDKEAHSFILGCMAMYGLARELTAELGVPVIDPGEAAILSAESLTKMRLSHSKDAYPYPPKLQAREACQQSSSWHASLTKSERSECELPAPEV